MEQVKACFELLALPPVAVAHPLTVLWIRFMVFQLVLEAAAVLLMSALLWHPVQSPANWVSVVPCMVLGVWLDALLGKFQTLRDAPEVIPMLFWSIR